MPIVLTDEQSAILQQRGTKYIKVLGTSWEDTDECLSRAFLKLCEFLDAYPEGEQWERAQNVWRETVKQAVVDNWRQVHRQSPEGTVEPLDRMTDGPETEYELLENQREVLNKTYEIFTEEDIEVLIAFVDADLNIAKAAKTLGMQRTNLYHVLRAIRARVWLLFPHQSKCLRNGEVAKAPFKQHYTRKSATLIKALMGDPMYKGNDWTRNYMDVEVLEYQGWSPAFWDQAEADKVHDVTIVKGIDRSPEDFVPRSSTVSHSEIAMFLKRTTAPTRWISSAKQ